MKNGLLSIREPFATRIFDGEKRYEFRSRPPVFEDKARFLVYVPSPRKELAGEMLVSGVVTGPPQDVWNQCKEEGGVSEELFISYFEDRDEAHALKIEKTSRYTSPAHLDVLRSCFQGFRPPQYLNWLSPMRLEKLRRAVQ